LPFGELKGVAGVLGKGWSVNLIGSYQTGLPQTVLNASAVSGIVGLSADRPNQVGSVSLSNPTLQEWFNLKTAVDSQRARQALDPLRFSTAAHFTKWVTTAVAPNTCG
jgi:hypothetical protein